MDRTAAARAIEDFLRALGRDPKTEPELAQTGARVAAAWADELLAGYDVNVDALVEGAIIQDGTALVAVRDIPVVTVCPHHLMVSTGRATVAFAPNVRLVGVGTVAALVDAWSRRLMLQEAVGEEVVTTLHRHLSPQWVACRIVMSHGCMTARGERAHGSRVETVARAGGDDAVVFAALGVGT